MKTVNENDAYLRLMQSEITRLRQENDAARDVLENQRRKQVFEPSVVNVPKLCLDMKGLCSTNVLYWGIGVFNGLLRRNGCICKRHFKELSVGAPPQHNQEELEVDLHCYEPLDIDDAVYEQYIYLPNEGNNRLFRWSFVPHTCYYTYWLSTLLVCDTKRLSIQKVMVSSIQATFS